ncbi:hypothetical protein NQ314_014112 [Rhamnusium bicolor]|uniref:Uncharacterized protein n=1 Tax=Rhamnusium bicolor TaxID=1586634 RepID=A0AAV8X3P4_9CUCU|nr:hypothetical protein NQ314_014112 [Rhamnusium bicolor]
MLLGRSLKIPSSGSKPKKLYYLKDYLEFILPYYVKPVNEFPNRENIPSVEKGDSRPVNSGVQEEQATSAPTEDH